MRYALALLLLSGSASAASLNPFVDEPAGLNPFADSAASCPCGDVCECPPGECRCPGCPHRTGEQVALAPSSKGSKPPHLVATVAEEGCGPCERFEREELPRLLRSGWRVDVRRVPFGSEVLPAFALRSGSKWTGYSNVADFEVRIGPPSKAVVPVNRKTVLQYPAPAAPAYRTVVRSDYHVHVCRCGHSWSHHDSNHGKAGPHRCPNCGRLEYDRAAESAVVRVPVAPEASAYGIPLAPGETLVAIDGKPVGDSAAVSYAEPVPRYTSGNCPGGNCPASSRRSGGGLFGWGILN